MRFIPAVLLTWCAIAGAALFFIQADEPAPAEPRKGPTDPVKALKEFRLSPGLRIELVAAEPQIESPVAMAFDEDGRLWVVEMKDYPYGPPKGKPPQGRIKILEDRDGDGVYETSTLFADNLLFANGIMPWRGGVIVTQAPSILHMTDTKGAGKADKIETLYEGFVAGNPQLRVSHPNLGIDNWIYVANGLSGGQVKRHGRKDAKLLDIRGMDFRFDLVRDKEEPVTGMGQYGNTFDDWGHRFVCTNRNHIVPIVLADRYVRRNPFLVPPQPKFINQNPGGAAQIFPLSKNWTTSSLHAGSFTAACGVMVYRGDLLPKEYYGSAFTCDPTGNLVHQEILRQEGATFNYQPAKKGVEFLATPDDWFRPVFLTHGPDGALYVIDMCRAVIEHPDFMPIEARGKLDINGGKDKGRIYRIVPEKHRTKPIRPKLSKATSTELVKLLSHPNAWHRTTAQRLLLERQDRDAIKPLQTCCETAESPQARLLAAWLLENRKALKDETILKLLNHSNGRVRENAVILSEPRLAKSPAIQKRVIELARDPDSLIRFQTALSLGEWDDPQMLEPLAHIAIADCEDPWARMAIASSVHKRAGGLIAVLLKEGLAKRGNWGRTFLLQELAALAGARQDPKEIADILKALLALEQKDASRWRMTALNGLADGIGRRGKQLGLFLDTLPKTDKEVVEQTKNMMKDAAKIAENSKRDIIERLAAVRLLAHAPWTIAEAPLTRMRKDDPEQQIRIAAVRALSAHPRPEVLDLLMKPWRSYTPAVRREVIETMFRQPDRIIFFLNEMKAGRIKPGDLDAIRSRQLVQHPNKEIRELAQKLLKDSLPEDRKKVLEQYKKALSLKGDVKRGREVFKKNCATCHLIDNLGVAVGPDISNPQGKTPEALMTDILNPNQAIDNNYVNYVVNLKSGKVVSGLIVAETASGITLKRAENQTDEVLRTDIEDIRSTGTSLMPDGLEKTINLQEMADLLRFLKHWRYEKGK